MVSPPTLSEGQPILGENIISAVPTLNHCSSRRHSLTIQQREDRNARRRYLYSLARSNTNPHNDTHYVLGQLPTTDPIRTTLLDAQRAARRARVLKLQQSRRRATRTSIISRIGTVPVANVVDSARSDRLIKQHSARVARMLKLKLARLKRQLSTNHLPIPQNLLLLAQRNARCARKKKLYEMRCRHQLATKQLDQPLNSVVGITTICNIPTPSYLTMPPANQSEASTSRQHAQLLQLPAAVIPTTLSTLPTTLRNSARHCYPTAARMELTPPKYCTHCNAKLFSRETNSLCCREGKIYIPTIPAPDDLLTLFTAQTTEGRHFRQNIRSYNHCFSFTSMGVSLDSAIPGPSHGIYTFRAHGAIYHRLGSLIPPEGTRPRFLQMFIYDTEHETEHRLAENATLLPELLDKIKHILDMYNPFVKKFRQLSRRPDVLNCRLIIRERPAADRQYTLPTASQVAAVLVGAEDFMDSNDRDIVVQTTGGHLLNVKDYSGFYDPLQYPLLLPHGSYGWSDILNTTPGRKLSCCDYYSYLLQIRSNSPSVLLLGGRLLQQYAVDNYAKVETQKLNWIRHHQKDIRAELYDGLQDCFAAGETTGENIGRKTILPSTFIGSPRDMYQLYQDAMSIVQHYGRPDIFLTMTCNPSWGEITSELLPGQAPHDRPDLLTRIFRSKYEELKQDIFHRGVLGVVIAHVHVIEFQKRGLPHAHMLVILDTPDKLSSPDDYDAVVRAELPDQQTEPELYAAVLKHMIHGPCGAYKPNASCMHDSHCSKGYPKPYAPTTVQGSDSYPVYRRRNDNRSVKVSRHSEFFVDNGWVVPYNSWLLRKYDCHLNVEVCCSIKSIKYLYKYIYKGPDHVAFEVRSAPNYDEVNKYVEGRWLCAPESLWKIFKFSMSRIYPSVERLQIHLPNKHQVMFHTDDNITTVLANERNSRTMLTDFFRVYMDGQEEHKYIYKDFPKYYRWLRPQRKWKKRTAHQKVVGRLYAVSPFEGERFYLRLLLSHVPGPKSFDDILTVNNIQHNTFRKAAEAYGLLEQDNSIRECLAEARSFRMPSALRRLFATILLYSNPIGVRSLWDENYLSMAEDFASSSNSTNLYIINKVLYSLADILNEHKRTLEEFDLPRISPEFEDLRNASSIIEHELLIPTPTEDLRTIGSLNTDQLQAFNTISEAITTKDSAIFFVDGPGGTGKTYLYRAILAKFRSEGCIILATASSGIAATLLPGGRTAHSKFKIPIQLDASTTCKFGKQSDLRTLIQQAAAIIWDEAPMTNRRAFETVDRTFQDMLGICRPFGGKVLILGGDFRQLTPVVVNGAKSEIINSSIVESHLWNNVSVLRLSSNMRAKDDTYFSSVVLRVGDGTEPTMDNDMIRVPNSMIIPWEGDISISKLVNFVFEDLSSHFDKADYMKCRAIITPLNEDVYKLNEMTLALFPGEEHIYYSFDSVLDDTRNLYLPEFLNSLSPGSLPPHKLTLKVGSPIMLLRNIDPNIGLCNGTRLLCRRFGRNIIEAEILTGQYGGQRVFLPRIPLQTPEDAKMPFSLTRKQFPVRLCFALTINKSQGQTIENVGIYLPENVFGHDQLYVAFSRGVSEQKTKILVRRGALHGLDGVYTKNVVYKEIFAKLNYQPQ